MISKYKELDSSVLMTHLIFVLSLSILIISCNKEDEEHLTNNPSISTGYDTLFPNEYFPVFPGSWWKYVDSDKDTVIASTFDSYVTDSYEVSGAAFHSDTFYVPYYTFLPWYDSIAIWGYEAHTGPISYSGSYSLTRILCDTMPTGSSWQIYNWSGTAVSRMIISKDTLINISGTIYEPTIVIEEYYSQGPPFYLWINRRYFTHSIGLIKEVVFNYTDSTTTTKELVDYHINSD